MLKPSEMKFMTPPDPKPGKDAVTQDPYLIENVDNVTFLIHRCLDSTEQAHFPAREQFEYEGRTYLWSVERTGSEADAEQVIKGVWRGIEKLNDFL